MPRCPSTRESLPKRIAAKLMDAASIVLSREELLPPFSMRRTIGESRWQLRGEEFVIQGNHFVQKLIEDAGLRPDSKVLDLGSGCGRIAIPLTKVLGAAGAYVGLEPMEELVRWCSREVTPCFPNFEFRHCNVCNSLYNRTGKLSAESFRFPLETEYFDLIVATSLFTHLTPKAVESYAGECSRVLKTGGKLFASFFLIENGMHGVNPGLDFDYVLEPNIARVIDPTIPERAVAYNTDWLILQFETKLLQLVPPIRWGCWTGKQPAYSGQDILIFEKLS
jgi:SAM-dependent methyltransferase